MLSFKKIMKNIDAIRAGATQVEYGQEWEIALEMTQGCGPEWYGVTYWTPADVIANADGMDEAEATSWLERNEDDLHENAITEGWDLIRDRV